jgi:hypothetical protein
MYGLKQAGRLANDQLITFLAQYGYRPVEHTLGLWSHNTCPIMFTLVVGDFGVQYTAQEDLDHLLDALRSHYNISFDPTGTKYCGMDLAWDYTKRMCKSLCPATSSGHYSASSTRHQANPNTRHTHACNPTMAQNHSSRRPSTTPNRLTNMSSNTCKRY